VETITYETVDSNAPLRQGFDPFPRRLPDRFRVYKMLRAN